MKKTGEPNNDKPLVEGRVEPSSAVIEQPPISRDCQQCVTYLTRALDRVGSRPQSLLRALGVVSHDNNNESENKLYEPTEDGKGILISLKKNTDVVAADGLGKKGVNSVLFQSQSADVPLLDSGSMEKIPSSAASEPKENYESISSDDGNVTLSRRFTNAATLLAEGIRQTAEDIINDGVVLTTSPAVDSTQLDQEVDVLNKNVTTIAVECMACGSDTLAEAGARAFVKGPDPLSIVLCSNRLFSQREVDEVLVHELVHIYDVHSRQMDLRDCKQLAYSEVRAAREAECNNRMDYTINVCVKDKATVATRNVFPNEGRECVCAVFDEAIKDRSPLQAVYAKGNDAPMESPRYSQR